MVVDSVEQRERRSIETGAARMDASGANMRQQLEEEGISRAAFVKAAVGSAALLAALSLVRPLSQCFMHSIIRNILINYFTSFLLLYMLYCTMGTDPKQSWVQHFNKCPELASRYCFVVIFYTVIIDRWKPKR